MFRTHTEVFRTPVSSADKCLSCPNSYRCEVCDQEWQSESEVFIHKRVHYSQEKLKDIKAFCWACIRKFETQPDLIEHFKECHLLSSPDAKHVEREIFVCNSCNAILFNKKMLEIHLAHLHCGSKVKREIECLKCHRKINVKSIWGHFYHDNMIGLNVCPICFTKFPDWHRLKDHLNEHPPYLHCYMCRNNYYEISAYKEHFKEHVYEPYNKSNIDEETDIFKKYFVHGTTTQLRRKLTPYSGLMLQEELSICVLCREICTSHKQQRHHILNHQMFKGKRTDENGTKHEFICSCGQIFYNRVLFKQHLLRNRGDEIIHFSV